MKAANAKDQPPFIRTLGREQPSLEFGPQRIHYMHSVALPQAYLTLFSVLQGLAFGVLIINFPLPKAMGWPMILKFLLQQYFYLPYAINTGMLIVIWILLVNVSLIGGWPHTFLQVALVVLLTFFEVLTLRAIPIFPLWLLFNGCISVVGGIILIRNTLMERDDVYNPNILQELVSIVRQGVSDPGLLYIIIGICLIGLTLGYVWSMPFLNKHAIGVAIALPWVILFCLVILLSYVIGNATVEDVHWINYILRNSDLKLSPHGVLRYIENRPDNEEEAIESIQASDEVSERDSKISKRHLPNKPLVLMLTCNVITILILGLLLKRGAPGARDR